MRVGTSDLLKHSSNGMGVANRTSVAVYLDISIPKVLAVTSVAAIERMSYEVYHLGHRSCAMVVAYLILAVEFIGIQRWRTNHIQIGTPAEPGVF
jgi:hypothetical protein